MDASSRHKQALNFRPVPFKKQVEFLESNTKQLHTYYENLSSVAACHNSSAAKIEDISKRIIAGPNSSTTSPTPSSTSSSSLSSPRVGSGVGTGYGSSATRLMNSYQILEQQSFLPALIYQRRH